MAPNRSTPTRLAIAAAGLALLAVPVLASAVSAAPATAPAAKTVVLKTASSPVGTILVDGKGRTVYRFTADSKGKSACSASCLTAWPPVIAPAVIPSSVAGVSGKLGVLKRAGGVRQLTINGWPLYTYAGDKAKGDMTGQGAAGGTWWVVSPSGALIKKSAGTSGGTTPSTAPSTPAGDYY